MNIGVLGTGSVGEAIATACIEKGHDVLMGSRTAGSEKGKAWVAKVGRGAAEGSFEEAALFGDLLFNCLNGAYALSTLTKIPPHSFHKKIVVDITNPLDFLQGMPPRVLEAYRDVSLGERIQQLLPDAFIVKALNTINYKLMVDARVVNNGQHDLFICGNDAEAKTKVKHFLADNFNWHADTLLDLGSIQSALAIEAIVPFWVLVWQSLGTPLFNFKVVH